MRIDALAVCVGYADFFRIALPRWMAGVETMTVISTPEDTNTAQLAKDFDPWAQVHTTDIFDEDGAWFNKGAAQEEFWNEVPKRDWLLLIDADIVPPLDWKTELERMKLEPGFLYGAYRYNESGPRIPDDLHGYGYFQLFHSSDLLAQVRPFFDTFWEHAGNGDSNIMLRWKTAGRLAPPLPLHLTHLGENHNWYGLKAKDKFREMEAERRRRGGGWASIEGERIDR